MLNLKSQNFESSELPLNQYATSFSKIWNGGSFWGCIYLRGANIDLKKVGDYLSQTALDLIMNSVEDDRIKLLEGILRQLDNSCKSVFDSENSTYEKNSFGLSTLLFLGDNVYIGLLGEIGCYLQKNSKVINFSKLLQKSGREVVSGKFEDSDLFLISPISDINFSNVYVDSLQEILNNYSLIIGNSPVVDAYVRRIDEYESSSLDLNNINEDKLTTIDDEEVIKEADSENPDLEDIIQNDFEETPLSKGDVYDEDEYYEEELDDDDFIIKNEEESDLENVPKDSNFKNKISSIGVFFKDKILPKIKIGFSKLGSFLGKIGTWVFETIVGFGGRSKYQTQNSKRLKIRRIILVIGVILFSLGLYLSVRWIKNENESRELENQYTTSFSKIESNLEEANSLSSYNSVEAKNILNTVIADSKELSLLDVEENKASELISHANILLDQIDKRVRLTNPHVVDLKIDYENAEPMDLVLFDNYIWVSDADSGVIYRVSFSDDSIVQVFTRSDGLQNPAYLASNDEKLYIYDLEKGLFVVSMEETDYEISPVTGVTPTTLGNVTEMAMYDSDGSLYFLISDESKVKKATAVGSGFSYPQDRAENEFFATAEDLEITHIIYTLADGGKFYRLEDSIQIEDSVGDLLDTSKFDLFAYSYAILLDRTEKRVLVLKQPESGSSLFKLSEQITVREDETRFFNDLKEVVVDVVNNRMYVLDGFRIIEVEIDG